MIDTDTLAEAVRLALGNHEGEWILCRDCGSVKHSQESHSCRAEHLGGEQVEAEGLMINRKKRAMSYSMEEP